MTNNLWIVITLKTFNNNQIVGHFECWQWCIFKLNGSQQILDMLLKNLLNVSHLSIKMRTFSSWRVKKKTDGSKQTNKILRCTFQKFWKTYLTNLSKIMIPTLYLCSNKSNPPLGRKKNHLKCASISFLDCNPEWKHLKSLQ